MCSTVDGERSSRNTPPSISDCTIWRLTSSPRLGCGMNRADLDSSRVPEPGMRLYHELPDSACFIGVPPTPAAFSSPPSSVLYGPAHTIQPLSTEIDFHFHLTHASHFRHIR